MDDGGPRARPAVNDPSGEAALVEHAVLESRIAELELRLRERVEENIVLDSEVRCLQREPGVYGLASA
jgi:hypothetical protein